MADGVVGRQPSVDLFTCRSIYLYTVDLFTCLPVHLFTCIGKLQTLRNEWLMVSGSVNCLWIVIIMTLSSCIDLQIAGTNPLSKSREQLVLYWPLTHKTSSIFFVKWSSINNNCVMTLPNSQHTAVYPGVCVVIFCHSVFLFCRSCLPNCVRFPLRPTILLHAHASLHHAVSLHCACAVPVWSELPDLHLLPVASSGPGWGAPADGSQGLGNPVHLPDQAGQIQETERNARENVREVEASS